MPKARSVKERQKRERELATRDECVDVMSTVRSILSDPSIADRAAEERAKGLWMHAHILRQNVPR